MENSRIALEQSKLADVLSRLEQVVDLPIDPKEIILDATIRRFIFTFELFWRWLKLIILEEGITVNFPKEVLKEAYKNHMIDDEEIWLQIAQRSQSDVSYLQ